MFDFSNVKGFDWDQGNARKNERHSVSQLDAEQVFFDQRLLVVVDHKHSQAEPRFHVLGKTLVGRMLHMTFTLRSAGSKIRVISARDMSRKERAIYERED